MKEGPSVPPVPAMKNMMAPLLPIVGARIDPVITGRRYSPLLNGSMRSCPCPWRHGGFVLRSAAAKGLFPLILFHNLDPGAAFYSAKNLKI